MFGFLKKKIKEITKKISDKVGKEEGEENIEKSMNEVKEENKKDDAFSLESKQNEIPIEEKKDSGILTTESIEKEDVIEKDKIIKDEEKVLIEPIEKDLEKFEDKKDEDFIIPQKEIEEKVEDSTKISEEIKKEKEEKSKEKVKRFKIFKLEKEIKESDINKLENEIKISLLQSDVALDVVNKIYSELRKELVGKSIKINEVEKVVIKSLKRTIFEILNQESIDIEKIILENRKLGKPTLIIFLGFNGSGKTTTLAKFANLLKEKGFSVVIAAGDTFRAASIEQLEEHAKNLNIKMIKHRYGADSAAVIYDAMKHAEANKIDVVLADTAGRSHSNTNLMEELKKICRVNKPDLKILVLDALTGNDIVNQCESFNNAVGVDGIIFTKVDVYDKGGSIISAAYTLRKPILFLGFGQGYEDIKLFNPEEVLNNIFRDIENT